MHATRGEGVSKMRANACRGGRGSKKAQKLRAHYMDGPLDYGRLKVEWCKILIIRHNTVSCEL